MKLYVTPTLPYARLATIARLEGETYWRFRARQSTARSMLDGVALRSREILRPKGERHRRPRSSSTNAAARCASRISLRRRSARRR